MAVVDRPADYPLNRTRLIAALALGAGLAAVVMIAAARPPASGSRRNARVPTEAQAREVLTRTHARAQSAPDASVFCADSQFRAICIGQYNDHGGRQGVPPEAPHVVESWVTGATRVLTVCGVDGQRKTYRADFPVEWSQSGSLLPTLEVFWDSKTYRISTDGEPIEASPRPQQLSC